MNQKAEIREDRLPVAALANEALPNKGVHATLFTEYARTYKSWAKALRRSRCDRLTDW